MDEYVDGAATTRTTNTVTLGGYDPKNQYTNMTSGSTTIDIATNGATLNVSSTINRTGITYDIRKWFSCGLDYEYKRRDSNFGKFDYKDNLVTLNASAAF